PAALSLRPKAPDPTEVLSETFPPARMLGIVNDVGNAINFLVEFLNERDPSRDKSRLEHLRP
ncbi:MAG: hypothetical protein ACREFQ_14600, partial [Stellaceae bacterium]